MKNTAYGVALKELLEEQYDLINNVRTCESWEDTIGRRKALEALDKIFAFLNMEERKNTRTRQQYY
ncbi:hypothetical protein GW915_00670 [bacterium]|nr:hypothetical protein [bacterium]